LIIIALIILLLIMIYRHIKAKQKCNLIRKDLNIAAMMPPQFDGKRFQLEQLPGIISAHHFGMPPALSAVNMRLLLIESVLSWPGLKVYEEVIQATDCIEVPYSQVTEEQWGQSMVVTWRWGKQKPMPHAIRGFSPMTDDQWTELLELMRHAQAAGFVFIWIDCESSATIQ